MATVDGQPYALEVNTTPGMSCDSNFVAGAGLCGLSHIDVVRAVLHGMAALRMVLLAYGRDAPPVTELLKLGVKHNALTERGWLQAGIADVPLSRMAASYSGRAIAFTPLVTGRTAQ